MSCRSIRISHEKNDLELVYVYRNTLQNHEGGVLDFSIYDIAEFGLDYPMPSK